MPFTTLDNVIAGMRPPQPLIKTGITMAAVGAARAYTPWYAGGVPGASVAPTIGVNGEAVTPALNTPAGVTGGRIARSNPAGGLESRVARLSAQPSQPGKLWLIDRLWQNSGLSPTLTTAQAITPAALPARSEGGNANGQNVLAAIEHSATGGAGTPTVTLTYTDQDNNAGATSTLAGVTTPPIGTFELFALANGDNGIRAPTNFIQSATRTSGAFHLVLFRLLAELDCPFANAPAAADALTGSFGRVYDDSVLQLVWFPSATPALQLVGSYSETQN